MFQVETRFLVECHKYLYYNLFYFLIYINDLEEGITSNILIKKLHDDIDK